MSIRRLTWRERLFGRIATTDPPKLPPPVAPRPVIIGSYNGYTLALWQDSIEHIKWAQEQFKTPMFRDMLAVLSNATPTFTPGDASSPTRFSYELGRSHGMRQLLQVIFALPQIPAAPQPDINPDYGALERFPGLPSGDHDDSTNLDPDLTLV